MNKFTDTFTRTVGVNANSFGIFQIAIDNQPDMRYAYKGDEWPTVLGVSISLLQVNHNTTEPTVCVRQYITHEDLKELSMLVWHAQRAYESRQKEAEAEASGEATGKTEA